MTKKQYILKLLYALEDSWPMAKGLRILVETDSLDKDVLDTLMKIFSSSIDEVIDEETKAKLQKGLEFLQKLKEAETKSQEQDQEDIDQLDKLLETI